MPRSRRKRAFSRASSASSSSWSSPRSEAQALQTNARDAEASALADVFVLAPGLEVVPWERLPPLLRSALGKRGDWFGVLCRRSADGSGGAASDSMEPLRCVDRRLALVLYALIEPAPLPAFVVQELGAEQAEASVCRWLADGLIERVGASRAAEDLRGAERRILTAVLAADDEAATAGAPLAARDLERRLYRAGAQPMTGSLRRALLGDESPDPGGVRERELARGFLPLGSLTAALQRCPEGERDGWLVWRPQRQAGASSTLEGDAAEGVYKLYLWQRTEDLPRVLRHLAAVAATAAELPFFELKVGCTIEHLLRCDKLMLYCESERRLHQCIEMLSPFEPGEGRDPPRGQGGVPFTCRATTDGLLSWAIDPPHEQPRLPARGIARSWREHVVGIFAEAIVATRHLAGASEALLDARLSAVCAVAAERGLDVVTWRPKPRYWEAR